MDKFSSVGIVPAGGKGTRLGAPYPKELLHVVGNSKFTPVIDYTICAMWAAGVQLIVVVYNDGKGALLEHLMRQPYANSLLFVYQKTKPMIGGGSSGLMEAIADAYEGACDTYGDRIDSSTKWIVGLPDTIMSNQDEAYAGLRNEIERDVSDVVLTCFETDHPERFGMVDVHLSSIATTYRGQRISRVKQVHEKPQNYPASKGWMWGAFAASYDFMGLLKAVVDGGDTKTQYSDLFNSFAIANTVVAVLNNSQRYFDLGTPQGINEHAAFAFAS